MADDVIRLRHEAGLTAGRSFPLRRGTFRFGPDSQGSAGLSDGEPSSVSFLLEIDRRDYVTVTKGDEPLAVEGVPVAEPVSAFPGDIIQLGTDHFSVESIAGPSFKEPPPTIAVESVPPIRQRRRLLPLPVWLLVAAIGFGLALLDRRWLILVGIALAGILIDVVWHGRRQRRAEQEHQERVAAATKRLSHDLQCLRITEARAMRDAYPGPASIADIVQEERTWSPLKAKRGDWRVAVASGDIEWSPPIAAPAQPAWAFEHVVSNYDFLAAVPFTVDLSDGPVGLVGPRAATTAVARHLCTSAMTQFHPRHLAVRVQGTEAQLDEWAWLLRTAHGRSDQALSALLREPVGGRQQLLLVDSAASTMRVDPASTQIFVAERETDLPAACTFSIVINENGTAFANMPGGAIARGLAPHGITDPHARQVVQHLATRNIMTADPSEAATIERSGLQGDGATVIDLRDRALTEQAQISHKVLVRAADPDTGNSSVAREVLTSISSGSPLDLFIIDRGDRKLIRLAQLPQCRRYAAIDDHRSLDRLIRTIDQTLDAASSSQRSGAERDVTLLIADLPWMLSFLRSARRADLAASLARVCRRPEPRLSVVAGAGLETALDAAVDTLFVTERAEEESPKARPTAYLFPSNDAAGGDLTGAVALIKRRTSAQATREPQR